MQNNSKSTENNFAEWLEKKQEKDPTLRVIRQQDLVPMNDTTCKHEHLELDESETEFDCVRCQNPKCGKMWLYPLGSVKDKFKKEK